MSLQQEIEDTKKQLEEALKAESEVPPEIEEEVKEEPAAVEEPAKPEPEPAKVEEEKPDDSAFARLRRESAANKRRAEEAEERLAAKEKPAEVEVETPEVPPLLTNMIKDYQNGLAEREFKSFESQISDPNYAAVTAEYANAMSAAIKMQNPRKSTAEIAEITKQTIIGKAAEFARAGYANPVEELFHEAKELGFTGKSMQREPEAKPEPKPDMAKVAENRRRNAGTASANGESKQGLTRRAIADNGISSAEWAKLPIEERKALMYGG